MITYETDIMAWANEQAYFLRSGNFAALDIAHLADEIEDVGKSEQRELANRMAVLMTHLLKWEFQPARRGSSWQLTIKEQRKAIARRLKNTPSLKNALTNSEWLADVWLDARLSAEKETQIDFDKFPQTCHWSTDLILLENWFPENAA